MARNDLRAAATSGMEPIHGADAEPQTPLQRQLDGAVPQARATPLDALAVARRRFHQGLRLDMRGIAAELGVSRVTLHRWVGTREQLLTEVLWESTDRALDRFEREVVARGCHGSRTAEILSRWARDVVDHPGVRYLQEEEPDLFFRLLTHNASVFQRRVLERIRQLLADDIEHGRVTVELSAEELAYVTVRIVESFIHTPSITGDAPDADGNARVLHAVLR
ncbi:QsdR family transcriptional regulator [Haloechinothrix alba]|nr:QsdR family transcriptional regulator [Haloechinothrix alba]